MGKPRIKVPRKSKVGQVVEIKCLIKHTMESGNRKDPKTGAKIPRKIINKFAASFGGKDVFVADMHPSVSANPYLSFFFKVPGPGDMTFTWTEDGGQKTSATKAIKIG